MISAIFPAYNEEENVAELHERLVSVLKAVGEPFEIIAIENASTDSTLEKLKRLAPITIISFAYNIGQTAALDAGIQAAKGDMIVVMDADLQNDPADIPKLINKMKEGYDVVVGWRRDRQDPLGRRIFSTLANKFTRWVAGLGIHDYGCALRAFKTEYLKDIRLYGVMHVFIPVILASRGAKVAEVIVRHHEREKGISKYTFTHMITDVADLLTIKFLYTYAARPLVFFGSWALISFAGAFFAGLVAVWFKIYTPLGFSQTPLPIIATLFTVLSLLLFMLGFITEILIRIYYETRSATPYRIRDIIENK
ncbi:MAG: glycosyltransferase family 2 protein [Candidatus Giovannonibacteria bacterium]|nr:glycosyltransferase family 2 protein [Candidatus Giovannonibacteria bacterium]